MGLTQADWRREAIRRGLIEPTPVEDTIARNLGDQLSFGWGDELQGEIAAFGHDGPEAERLRQEAVAASRRRLEEAQQDRPLVSAGTAVASYLIPAAGELALARGALGAGRIAAGVNAARTVMNAPRASEAVRAASAARIAQLSTQGRQIGRRALYGTSAAHGATYGAGSANDGDRLIGAGSGAVANTIGAGVGEAIGHGAAMAFRQLSPEVRAARLINRRLQESQPTEQDLMRRLIRQGRTPAAARAEARRMVQAGNVGRFTTTDMVNRAAHHHSRSGTPAMVEMIPQAARDARAIVAVDGPGASIIDNTLNAQRESLGRDVAQQAEQTFRPRGVGPRGGRGRGRQGGGIDNQPPPTGLQDLSERITTASRAQNAANYRVAYRSTLTEAQQRSLATRMSGGSFKERARSAAIDRAEEDLARIADDLENATSSGAPQARIGELQAELQDTEQAIAALRGLGDGAADAHRALNVRAIDLYQRGLRHLSDEAGGATTEGGRNIFAVRRTFMDNIRSISPELHDAVANARGFKALEEARDLGRQIFAPGREAEIDQMLRRQMTTDEQDAFMVGALDAIEQRLGANDLSFIRSLQRNQNWRAMVMRSTRSRRAGMRLLNLIDDKVAQADRANFIRGGSQTTPIAQDVRRLTTDEGEMGFLQDVIDSGGNIRNPLIKAAAGAWDRFNRPGIRNPQVQAEMARMLMQPGTEANTRALATRLDLAPKTPVLTPRGQAMGTAAGMKWAGQLGYLAPRNDFMRGLTGANEMEQARDSAAAGDFGGAAGNLALAGLAAVPALEGAGPLVRGGAAALGATILGAGVADARKGQAPDNAPAWARQFGMTRVGPYTVSPPGNADADFPGDAPRWSSLERESVSGPYVVFRSTSPSSRGARFLFEKMPQTNQLIPRGRIIEESDSERVQARLEQHGNGIGFLTSTVANIGARALLGRAGPLTRNMVATGAGMGAGGLGESLAGGDPVTGVGEGLATAVPLAARGGVRALRRAPERRTFAPSPWDDRHINDAAMARWDAPDGRPLSAPNVNAGANARLNRRIENRGARTMQVARTTARRDAEIEMRSILGAANNPSSVFVPAEWPWNVTTLAQKRAYLERVLAQMPPSAERAALLARYQQVIASLP